MSRNTSWCFTLCKNPEKHKSGSSEINKTRQELLLIPNDDAESYIKTITTEVAETFSAAVKYSGYSSRDAIIIKVLDIVGKLGPFLTEKVQDHPAYQLKLTFSLDRVRFFTLVISWTDPIERVASSTLDIVINYRVEDAMVILNGMNTFGMVPDTLKLIKIIDPDAMAINETEPKKLKKKMPKPASPLDELKMDLAKNITDVKEAAALKKLLGDAVEQLDLAAAEDNVERSLEQFLDKFRPALNVEYWSKQNRQSHVALLADLHADAERLLIQLGEYKVPDSEALINRNECDLIMKLQGVFMEHRHNRIAAK